VVSTVCLVIVQFNDGLQQVQMAFLHLFNIIEGPFPVWFPSGQRQGKSGPQICPKDVLC
jgi:hypothetical protein